MTTKKLVSLAVLFVMCQKSFAQVNLQTGSATFSLPMFNWQDDKSRLQSVVALSYNSGSGLKVDEVASNAGQGWSMIAGGAITRLQVGEPDDQKPYPQPYPTNNGSELDLNRYPPGYLYATVPASNGCPIALMNYPIYKSKNQLYAQNNLVAEDKQLDYFSFQFNGKAGLFVLDAATNTGVSLGDSKMQISFQKDESVITNNSSGIRTTISSFTIKDVDGLIYKFTKKGLTKVLKSEYCDASATYTQKTPKFKDGHVYYQGGFDEVIVNPWIVNSWSLTEIDDALTGRAIFFRYNTLNIDTKAGQEITFNDANNDYCIVGFHRSITQTPELDSIAYPDGHSVKFNYSSTSRFDVNGEYPLASVDIKYQGRYLSKYNINTSYFILNRYGTPVSNYEKKVARLCLKSVQKFGVDLKESTAPYLFDYYLGSDNSDDFIPPPFFYAKDIWGFYNGSNNTGTDNSEAIPLNANVTDLNYNQLRGLCHLLRNGTLYYFNYFTAKPGYAKNGLLRQIVYPTGGTLTYEYDQNIGYLNSGNQSLCGVHVSKTSSTDGGYSNSCSNPVATNYNYVLADGSSSLWGLEMPVSSMITNNHYLPEGKHWHMTWSSLPLGECTWRYQYPGILSQNQAIDLPGWINVMNSLAPALGILNVISTVKDAVTAFTGGSPVALVIDLALDLIQIGITCFSSNEKNYLVGGYVNFDYNSGNSLPIQFKRVEIVENPGTIGKTVQTFTSKDDYGLWVGENANTTFSSKQRFAPWAYGLPNVTTVYDANGNKVKETQNVYNFNTAFAAKCANQLRYDRSTLLKTPLNKISTKCLVKYNTSQNNKDWADPNVYGSQYQTASDSHIGVDTYDLYTGRTELDTVYERVYKQDDPSKYVETVTGYGYNDDNYEVSFIRTIGSDGKTTQKNIFYTIDYVKTHTYCYDTTGQKTTNLEINRLVQNNIISLPVETNELIDVDHNALYTYDKATLFTTLTNGDVKPYKILEGRFAQPVFRNSPWPTEYSYFSYWKPGPLLDPASPDYSFYKTAQTLDYAQSGDLVSTTDEGGRTVSSIYGYNDKYVIASAINAKSSEIFFEPFESQTGWNGAYGYGSAISAFDNTVSHSGNYSARIDKPTVGETVCHSNQALNISLTSPTSFRISGWVYSNGPSADMYLFMYRANETGYYTYVDYATTNVTNQWVFLQKDIVVPADVVKLNVRIDNNGGGTVWFDDIRVYPSKGRMMSYTYDPLVGKTSESDVNDRVTYYNYDNLGRIQFIKDEKKNIVKMYEYNSTSKQNGCPGTYHNHLITETYTRNNCSSGYFGGNVQVSVAANTYSSTVSQADADAQAENYLLTNGQNTANSNGSCSLIYYNTQQSQVFTTENCDLGYRGGTITYTVPAGRYSSIISQADADEQATDDITANGWAYANDPSHAVCVIDTAADFQWSSGGPTYCANVNGQLPAHLFVQAVNVNPNSPSYNTTAWMDIGPSTSCPSNYYYNTPQSGAFTKNNCSSGSGTSVTYTVPAGTYSSTVSLADANQQAINDVNANGQNYANANGSCCSFAFNWASGVSYTYAYTGLSGSVVNFTIVFNYTAGYGSMTAGSFAGPCTFPTGTRIIPYTNGSTVFNVIVSTNGAVQVQYVSGAYPSGTIGFTGSYDLYANSYYSAAASGTYTRNNCASGQTGSSVTYSVPAYKYRSTISQADANQQAQNDVIANGQSYANSNGTCSTVVAIIGSNSRSSGYVVTFTNGSFNQSFYIYAGANSVNLGTIPTGTYSVTFQMTGGSPPYVNFSIGSYSAYSVTTYTFSNVSISSTTFAQVF